MRPMLVTIIFAVLLVVRFKVITAVKMTMLFFWIMILCSLVSRYQHFSLSIFRAMCTYELTQCHKPEEQHGLLLVDFMWDGVSVFLDCDYVTYLMSHQTSALYSFRVPIGKASWKGALCEAVIFVCQGHMLTLVPAHCSLLCTVCYDQNLKMKLSNQLHITECTLMHDLNGLCTAQYHNLQISAHQSAHVLWFLLNGAYSEWLYQTLNVVGKWLTHLLHIYEVLGSNLGLEIAILTEVFCGFPQPLQVNARLVP
jgi:hypothetical protein